VPANKLLAHHRLRELAFWLIVALGGYFLMSLLTFSAEDPGWSYIGPREIPVNLGGTAGAWIASVFLGLFGYLAYLFPFMLAWSGWLIFRERNQDDSINYWLVSLRWGGFLLTVMAGSTLSAMHVKVYGGSFPEGPGGILGQALQSSFVDLFSATGSSLLLVAVFLGGWTVFTGISWFTVMDWLGEGVLWILGKSQHLLNRLDEYRDARQVKKQRSEVVQKQTLKKQKRKPPKISSSPLPVETSVRVEKEKQVPLFEAEQNNVELPSLSLLDPPKHSGVSLSAEALKAMSQLVEIKLADFGIEAQVESVHPGPVVTLFELHLAAGTKASKVTSIAKDLARALSTISVRVVEVIPGKSVIGIEIPNESREIVFLSEVLRSQQYDNAKSVLTIALGKNIAGEPVVTDLGKMPHGLIAGTTGSGKSVAINAMILSLLYKATPEQVRLIMIDPKMLELSVYADIPHLLTPVVTDMKEAANSLRWCVAEMERRYKLMANQGVRNIAGFNRKVKDAAKAGRPIKDPFFKPNPLFEDEEIQEAPDLVPLPYIVVVIDELADMMMVVGKKVEQLIARLAQKARAAGIHLLLATQRPSVDVITGLIKANIPTRLAFQVSSRIDSRTILDQMGAEHLLGHGDSLYLGPGSNNIPMRIHGAFVDDNEVHRVVSAIKKMGKPNYLEEIVQEPTEPIPGLSPEASGVETEDADPLFDEAVRIVTESRRASISGVQRRLKIGYNRAARMIEEMERIGVVSAPETNGNREVLAPPPPKD